MLIIKILLILSFIVVFIQDVKERQVYWSLFPVIGICSGILLYNNISSTFLAQTLMVNFIFIGILLLVIFLYSKLKLKTNFNNVFGLGDLFLFLALGFSFSSLSFIIFFVFSLVFSLTLHLMVKKNNKHKTVPLAGYMSLFFVIIYSSHWLNLTNSIYTI